MTASPPLRILVPDRFMVFSGVETINRQLLPALVRRGAPVCWAAPEHRIPALAADAAHAGLAIENAFWPRRSPRRWWEAFARRAGRASAIARRWEQRSYRRRLEQLARAHAATHALSTWILSEDFPGLPLPHSALFLDRNWACAPGESPASAKARLLDRRVTGWAQGAHAMLAISEAAAAELRALAPEHAHKVVVMPLAASRPTEAPAPPPTSAGTPVFYYPATANPHKNHRTLFAAAAELAREGRAFQLLLSGFGTPALLGPTPLVAPRLEEARQCYRANHTLLGDRVEARGYGTTQDVEANYARSAAVVLPSEYEGFGLPLIEALVRQRAVIAADIAPFREQVARFRADAAVRFFPPDSPAALADRLRAFITTSDVPSASELATVARRVAAWTWDDVADVCLHALQR